MTDFFQLVGLPAAPWVDAEVLKERFLRLSAERHPDAGGSSAGFAALNEAWQTLREPAGCLRHYLQISHPAVLSHPPGPPPDMADEFMEIAAARQAAQQMVAKLAGAGSSLSRSLLEPERRGVLARLQALEERLSARNEGIYAELKSSVASAEALQAILMRMVFLSKWLQGLREARASL